MGDNTPEENAAWEQELLAEFRRAKGGGKGEPKAAAKVAQLPPTAEAQGIARTAQAFTQRPSAHTQRMTQRSPMLGLQENWAQLGPVPEQET